MWRLSRLSSNSRRRCSTATNSLVALSKGVNTLFLRALNNERRFGVVAADSGEADACRLELRAGGVLGGGAGRGAGWGGGVDVSRAGAKVVRGGLSTSSMGSAEKIYFLSSLL